MSELKLSLDELRQLMREFSASGLTSMTLKDGEFVLKLGAEKASAPVYMVPPAAGVAAPAAVPAPGPPAAGSAAPPPPPGEVVKGPVGGGFFAPPAPH